MFVYFSHLFRIVTRIGTIRAKANESMQSKFTIKWHNFSR